MRQLPSGTVTFLFSDIEGSTRLLDELGADAYAQALAEHRRVMREAFTANSGVEVDTQGDAFFVAFPTPTGALAAARDAQAALAAGPIRVRIGIHSGEPLLTGEGYVGIDVHRGARVMSAGHGGQVLVSAETYALLEGDVDLRELGRHRLKDLTEPQPLYQLGAGDFPPLKTLYQTNLPVQPTPLVGREAELAEVLSLLKQSRLVTLTGAGGSGKTRLALQAAAELVDTHKDGVWWVPLAAVRDPALVEPTIAQVLSAKESLGEHLAGKQALLLLDNFEQLLGAATLLGELLATVPELRILVTSRERLNLSAEHEYQVPTLISSEAVALFTARARQLRSGFDPDEHVAEICRCLDGLPLAVELAAARVKVLAPQQILERLGKSLDVLTAGARDAPERQRTLRATIEWSYDLLELEERELFARLSVFAGSFDVEAAEAVCAADLADLAALVDKSLLRPTADERFFMLETIRQFALERLGESGEEGPLRPRHAEYFRDFADTRSDAASLSDPSVLRALDLAQPNFRAALTWGLESASPAILLSLLDGLWMFWLTKGYAAEAYEWARRVVRACAAVHPDERLAGWHAAGEIARFVGDVSWSEALKAEEVQTARATGNDHSLAFVLHDLAQMAADRGDLESARALAEEGIAVRERMGEELGLAHAHGALAYVEFKSGNYARAREISESTLKAFESAGRHGYAMADRMFIGDCLRRDGDTAGAAKLLREALVGLVSLGHTYVYAELLQVVAALAEASGRYDDAAVLLGASDRLYRETRTPIWDEDDRDRIVAAVRGELGNEQFEAAWGRGTVLDVDEALELGRAVLA